MLDNADVERVPEPQGGELGVRRGCGQHNSRHEYSPRSRVQTVHRNRSQQTRQALVSRYCSYD